MLLKVFLAPFLYWVLLHSSVKAFGGQAGRQKAFAAVEHSTRLHLHFTSLLLRSSISKLEIGSETVMGDTRSAEEEEEERDTDKVVRPTVWWGGKGRASRRGA